MVSQPRTTEQQSLLYLFTSDASSDAAVPAEHLLANVVAGVKDRRDHGRVAKAHA